jgi:YVTN family beta-propeller protein
MSRRLVAIIEGGFGASVATRVDVQRQWILGRPGIHSYVVPSRPVGISAAPDGRKFVAHAPDDKPGAVTVFNSDWTVRANIPLPGKPAAIAVSPDGARAYVADWQNSCVRVINTAQNALDGQIAIPASPTVLAVKPDGSRLYVLNHKQVSVVDTVAMQVLTSVRLDARLTAMAVAPDGTRLYVTNADDGEVKIIDTAQNTVTGTWDVGGFGNTAIVATANRVYIGSDGEDVCVRDAAGAEVTEVKLSPNRSAKALALSGTHLYVGYETTNSSNLAQAGVQIYDTQALHGTSQTRELGGAPIAALTVTSAGDVLAVNRDVSSISIIS